jgi:urease accessory protein
VGAALSDRSVLAGRATLSFRLAGARTVLKTAFAASPLRILEPRNHGKGAWVFLATLGGGLVDGDRIDLRVDASEGTLAFLGTQASTKIYRSPHGCSQRLEARVADGAALAIVPDPVACFADARYTQETDVWLAPEASLLVVDGYTCGRSARGERWEFARYSSRTTVVRAGTPRVIDATRLDREHGPIAARMGRFDVVMSLLAIGPRFAPVRDALLAPAALARPGDRAIAAASPIGTDGAIARVAAERFESASSVLRASFAALASVLGDDPFARKW